MLIKFKLLSNTARPFTYKTDGSACMDMYSDEDVVLHPQDYAVINTNVAVEIPDGYYGLVKGRSGLATKGITSHVGTIDSDYRGPVKAILYNHGDTGYCIKKGDRVCQIEIRKVIPIELEQVDRLSDTIRGTNGFGSTGR